MAVKVAVVGRFDPRSASLERIGWCLRHILQNCELLFLSTAAGMPTALIQTLDWVLLWRDSIVCEAMPIWRQVYRGAKRGNVRIGALGLAIHHVPLELQGKVAKLLDVSGFCFVRDARTSTALNNHERIEISTDVTWCSPFSDSAAARQETADIAVHLRPHLLAGFDPQQWLNQLDGFSALAFPMDFSDGLEHNVLRSYFSEDVPDQFTLAPLEQSRLALVSSYHAAVFAMQLGKPFIAVDHDHDLRELMRDAGLDDCLLTPADHEMLPRKIRHVLSDRTRVRERVCDYAQRQRNAAALLIAAVRKHLQSGSRQAKNGVMD